MILLGVLAGVAIVLFVELRLRTSIRVVEERLSWHAELDRKSLIARLEAGARETDNIRKDLSPLMSQAKLRRRGRGGVGFLSQQPEWIQDSIYRHEGAPQGKSPQGFVQPGSTHLHPKRNGAK